MVQIVGCGAAMRAARRDRAHRFTTRELALDGVRDDDQGSGRAGARRRRRPECGRADATRMASLFLKRHTRSSTPEYEEWPEADIAFTCDPSTA